MVTHEAGCCLLIHRKGAVIPFLIFSFQDNWPPETMSLEIESTGEGNEQGKQSESFLIPRKQQVGAGH